MKRPLLTSLIIAVAVGGVIAVLHATRVLLPIERPIAQLVSRDLGATKSAADFWQYLLTGVLAFGVAAFTLTTPRRGRLGWIVLALLIELAGLAWVCVLYRTFFQPLPSMLAVVLAFAAGERWAAITTRSRTFIARSFFGGRLSKQQVGRLIAGEIPFEDEPQTCDVSIVVCDIANKYDLADGATPAAFAEVTEKFIHRATDLVLEAGGYVEAADGEGVVAIFGFPDRNDDHGNKAVRVALDVVQAFRTTRAQSDGERSGEPDVHVGISSGTVIIAPLHDGERPALITSGEPVELARRFCVANRFYGSRILIGPQTFELTSREIVARPIDFLSGVNSQERHEIYEPLWLAAEAKPEHLARRDCFWNGVVLYREKRWAEAYSEFQKARGPDADDDAPLQLYLRRLEPLALQLMETPSG
ncbi:MAG TPA: adenylate/guanylate cyclase domain-containing protein [Chthoniobacterales bacterium]|nr:adenylate/guanylate cyclase domain-containing protein [Chthoniobacterales bacterium]